MLVSKPILEYCVSVWASCNVGLLDEIFKVQNDVRVLSSMLPSRLERYRYFINFDGCLLTIFVLKDV